MRNLAETVGTDSVGSSRNHSLHGSGNAQLMIEPRVLCLEVLRDDDAVFVFYRGKLFATYDRDDWFSRNHTIVQLFLCHKIKQSILSDRFKLSVQRIRQLIKGYRERGSQGVQSHVQKIAMNRLKITEKIGEFVALLRRQEKPPTYEQISAEVRSKFRVKIAPLSLANWWQARQRLEKKEVKTAEQLQLVSAEDEKRKDVGIDGSQEEEKQLPAVRVLEGEVVSSEGSETWRPNVIAGSFILYAMLAMSGFMKPFQEKIQGEEFTDRDGVERVLLTLFFLHALRFKSIEQSKHLAEEHFAPVVGGVFHRVQNLRYAVDRLTEHAAFDEALELHYKNLAIRTDMGDEIYYTDGHFSCYYGKHSVPKGYDPRRQRPSRGRTSVYLHNSLGQNVFLFESPTNTSLSVDIETLVNGMKKIYGQVKGKSLFFDRGGFSSKCFRILKNNGMYFTTYLKNKKKESQVRLELFEERSIIIDGEVLKYRIYEKERELKRYGKVRTILFLGSENEQIPVISTNPHLTAEAIIARQKGRWKEENCYKFMGDHFAFDLMTTYKTEQAPEKIIKRPNPERQEINAAIHAKKADLIDLQRRLAIAVGEAQRKDETTLSEFEKQQSELHYSIKNVELDIALLEGKRTEIPPRIEVNLADECVITKQRRRMLINLVKAMNYNCEKWLQQSFVQVHAKKDETLSLIRRVITQPGRIRTRGNTLEVEVERLDNTTHAASLDQVIDKFNQYGYFRLPNGSELKFRQAPAQQI